MADSLWLQITYEHVGCCDKSGTQIQRTFAVNTTDGTVDVVRVLCSGNPNFPELQIIGMETV